MISQLHTINFPPFAYDSKLHKISEYFLTNLLLTPLTMDALSLLLPTLVALVSQTFGIQITSFLVSSVRSPAENPIFSREPAVGEILNADSDVGNCEYYSFGGNPTPRIALFVRSLVRNKISAASYTHAP